MNGLEEEVKIDTEKRTDFQGRPPSPVDKDKSNTIDSQLPILVGAVKNAYGGDGETGGSILKEVSEILAIHKHASCVSLGGH